MDTMSFFLLTSLALVGSPGPNTLSLAAIGAAFGVRQGLPYMLGLNLGMAGVLMLIGSGLWAVLYSFPAVARIVTWAATAYLIYLAFRIAAAPPLRAIHSSPGLAPRWYAGAILSLTNPKAYIAVAAVNSQYSLQPDHEIADQFAKGSLLLLTIVFVNVLWLGAGFLLARHVTTLRASRIINICFAGTLLLSVVAASFF